MSIKIECVPKDVIEKSTDRRGRLTLGSDYANAEVTLLVVKTDDE